MPVPHYDGGTLKPQQKGILSHQGLFEPVHPNLFEISFIFPPIVQQQGYNPYLMLENATSIDLDKLTPEMQTSTQRFKYSTRVYMNTPESTHTEFGIKFNVNIGKAGDVFVYNALRAWYDLVWNSQNGTLYYKSDICGSIIVNMHDRKGYVIRRVTLNNVQIKGINGYAALDWSQSGILESIDANFVADYWEEEKIDVAGEIVLPNLYG